MFHAHHRVGFGGEKEGGERDVRKPGTDASAPVVVLSGVEVVAPGDDAVVPFLKGANAHGLGHRDWRHGAPRLPAADFPVHVLEAPEQVVPVELGPAAIDGRRSVQEIHGSANARQRKNPLVEEGQGAAVDALSSIGGVGEHHMATEGVADESDVFVAAKLRRLQGGPKVSGEAGVVIIFAPAIGTPEVHPQRCPAGGFGSSGGVHHVAGTVAASEAMNDDQKALAAGSPMAEPTSDGDAPAFGVFEGRPKMLGRRRLRRAKLVFDEAPEGPVVSLHGAEDSPRRASQHPGLWRAQERPVLHALPCPRPFPNLRSACSGSSSLLPGAARPATLLLPAPRAPPDPKTAAAVGRPCCCPAPRVPPYRKTAA